MDRLLGDERAGRLLRFAAAGVIAWTVAMMVRFLYFVIVYDWPHPKVQDALGLAACAAPVVILVLLGFRSESSWSSRWLLAAVAAVIIGILPSGGALWPPMLSVIAGLGLIYLRPLWSAGLFAACVGGAVAVTLSHPFIRAVIPENTRAELISYDVLAITWLGTGLAVLVWLVRTLRELQAARRELADRALVIERHRIDDELSRTVGRALDLIVASGEVAAWLVRENPEDHEAAAAELRALTARSRTTLATARSVLTGYRNVSLDAELRAVVTLLAAAGIRAELVLPAGELPEELPAPLRVRLRADAAVLLDDRDARECTIALIRDPAGELDLRLARTCALAGDGAP